MILAMSCPEMLKGAHPFSPTRGSLLVNAPAAQVQAIPRRFADHPRYVARPTPPEIPKRSNHSGGNASQIVIGSMAFAAASSTAETMAWEMIEDGGRSTRPPSYLSAHLFVPTQVCPTPNAACWCPGGPQQGSCVSATPSNSWDVPKGRRVVAAEREPAPEPRDQDGGLTSGGQLASSVNQICGTP